MATKLLPLLLLLLSSLLAVAAELPKLRVSVILAEGFCEYKNDTKQWTGFVPDVVDKIGELAQFKAELLLVGDGRYGQYEENIGKWNGMIGEVVAGKADMAAAPLTQTALREAHIDFTHELLDVGLVTISQAPIVSHPVTRSAAFFLSVFDFGVWLSAVVVFIVTSLLLTLNGRYNPREPKAEGAGQSFASAIQDGDFSLLGSLFFAISTGCFQGYTTSPKSLAGRCLSVFWWTFAAIFGATYVAGFLCALIASKGSLEDSFVLRNPRDQTLLNQQLDDFVPVWLPDGSTERMMKNSTDPLFRLLWRLNSQRRADDKQLDSVKSIADIVKLIEGNNKYFGVMESDMAMLESRKSNCRLMVSGTLLTDKSYAFALPENSTWRAKINHAIMVLRENGFIRQLYNEHFGSVKGYCGPPPKLIQVNVVSEELASTFRDSLPIGLGTFAGPVGFYCLGLLLSFLAAVVDGYIYTRYERYRQPAQQPFQSLQEPQEPSFGTLAFSDDRQPVVSAQDS